MINCNHTNRWSLQKRYWSIMINGMDTDGNALLIFTRSPYSVHDFINRLLALPIDISKTMYLEGRPEASFYLNHPNQKVAQMRSYKTGFKENDLNDFYWALPNVIGVKRKVE